MATIKILEGEIAEQAKTRVQRFKDKSRLNDNIDKIQQVINSLSDLHIAPDSNYAFRGSNTIVSVESKGRNFNRVSIIWTQN